MSGRERRILRGVKFDLVEMLLSLSGGALRPRQSKQRAKWAVDLGLDCRAGTLAMPGPGTVHDWTIEQAAERAPHTAYNPKSEVAVFTRRSWPTTLKPLSCLWGSSCYSGHVRILETDLHNGCNRTRGRHLIVAAIRHLARQELVYQAQALCSIALFSGIGSFAVRQVPTLSSSASLCPPTEEGGTDARSRFERSTTVR